MWAFGGGALASTDELAEQDAEEAPRWAWTVGASPVLAADGFDWLQNLVPYLDALGCVDPIGNLTNRGTEYEWARFFWSMTTVHGNTIPQMWDLWDLANPHDWDANGGTPTVWDDPTWRMGSASLGVLPPLLGYSNAAADHGLDH